MIGKPPEDTARATGEIQTRKRRNRVGDTAQLGNARVDIPIAIQADGNAQRAAAAHLGQTPHIKEIKSEGGHRKSKV